jgi:hypothetical protein
MTKKMSRKDSVFEMLVADCVTKTGQKFGDQPPMFVPYRACTQAPPLLSIKYLT